MVRENLLFCIILSLIFGFCHTRFISGHTSWLPLSDNLSLLQQQGEQNFGIRTIQRNAGMRFPEKNP